MQVYNPNCQQITLVGITYAADDNGIIDVPDDKMNSSVWAQGFVVATGRIAQLAAEAEAANAPVDTVKATAKPVKPEPQSPTN